MLLTAWCNQLRWHQCSSGLPAIIPLTTRYWNRPVGGDDGRDCVSRSNRKWQLKSCRLIAIGPQKRLAALMVKTFSDEALFAEAKGPFDSRICCPPTGSQKHGGINLNARRARAFAGCRHSSQSIESGCRSSECLCLIDPESASTAPHCHSKLR